MSHLSWVYLCCSDVSTDRTALTPYVGFEPFKGRRAVVVESPAE